MSKPSKHIVRPYGDATGDGMVQMSFTLPLPHDKRAEGAAQLFASKMGMDPAMVVHAKPMGPDFGRVARAPLLRSISFTTSPLSLMVSLSALLVMWKWFHSPAGLAVRLVGGTPGMTPPLS